MTRWTQVEDPAHVVTFGRQVHSKGILGGTEEAGRHIGYLTKYLTKSTGEVVEADTARQRDHHDRLHAELSVTPCSPRCAVWLLYGIQPKGANAQDDSGALQGAGASADHARAAGAAGAGVAQVVRQDARRPQGRPESLCRTSTWPRSGSRSRNRTRPGWSGARSSPATRRCRLGHHLVMRAIAERITWKAEYDRALLAAAGPPGARNFGNSAGGLTWGKQ